MERKKIFLKFLLKRVWLLTVLVALLGIIIGGTSCNSGSGGNKPSSNTTSCTTNSDCLTGYVCQNGQCVIGNVTLSTPTNLT
ncbi:MAG: hypothetical protein ACP5MB_09610, partial [bacterium]